MEGAIKWFDTEKGYGFISSAAGDIFLHVSALAGLREGSRVVFNCVPGHEGRPVATDAHLVPPGYAAPTTASANAAETDERTDAFFRGMPWRSSPADVMSREGAPAILAKNDHLAFEGTVAGISCAVHYHFVDRELARGFYSPYEEDPTRLLSNFKHLELLLGEKYGVPKSDDYWEEGRRSPVSRPTAIARGQLSLYRTWLLPSTEISLSISAQDLEVAVFLSYQSRALAGAVQDARNDDFLRDL